MSVFIDSTTGELKYQGTSGTPAILAEGDGAVHLVPMVMNFPIVSAVSEIDSATYTAIGNLLFDPSSIFDGNTKITRSIQFRAVLYAASGVTGRVRLYNLTTGAEVSSSTLSSSDAAPTVYSATLTVGGNIPNSSNLYEVQLQITSPAVPSPGDYIVCTSASIVVSYA